ncbi:hypothetical protein VTN96DRAFT_2518 [Rasamsonia emersonii]
MPENNPHASQGVCDKDRTFAPQVSLPRLLTLNEETSTKQASHDAVDVSTLGTSPDTADNVDPTLLEEASLFSTLDPEHRDRLTRYIANHPFIVNEGPVVRRQEWHKFTQDLRAEAATVGLDEEAIQRVIRYVRKLYRGLYKGNVHYDDGSTFEVEEIGGDHGHVKRKKRERRKRGSSGATKSNSKKLKQMLENESPVEDGSAAALSTESDATSAIPVIEVTQEAITFSQANLSKTSELNTNDTPESRENKENAAPGDINVENRKKPTKQKTKRPAKVSHHFAKNRKEGKSTASSPSGRKKNPKQSKPADTGKRSEADTAKSKEAREATIKARSHRKRVRRRERLRERKAQERAAKADGRPQATNSNATKQDEQSPARADMSDFRTPMIRKA